MGHQMQVPTGGRRLCRQCLEVQGVRHGVQAAQRRLGGVAGYAAFWPVLKDAGHAATSVCHTHQGRQGAHGCQAEGMSASWMSAAGSLSHGLVPTAQKGCRRCISLCITKRSLESPDPLIALSTSSAAGRLVGAAKHGCPGHTCARCSGGDVVFVPIVGVERQQTRVLRRPRSPPVTMMMVMIYFVWEKGERPRFGG